MKNHNKREIEQTTVSEEEVLNTLKKYRQLFQAKEDYQELEHVILNYLMNLKKNNNKNLSYIDTLLKIRMEIISFISQKVQNGDIELEIQMIGEYAKYLNVFYPKIKEWINKSTEQERKQIYFQMVEAKRQQNSNVEKRFFERIWENSISETLADYNAKGLFTEELTKVFKNKLLYIDEEFNHFINNKHLSNK